jgi:hypothetical protein
MPRVKVESESAINGSRDRATPQAILLVTVVERISCLG